MKDDTQSGDAPDYGRQRAPSFAQSLANWGKAAIEQQTVCPCVPLRMVPKADVEREFGLKPGTLSNE